MLDLEYVVGSDLGDAEIEWLDGRSKPVDFSVPHTYELKVGIPGQIAQFTKVAGITGASTLPNLTVSWDTVGELNTLGVGEWVMQIKATRTSDGKQRFLHKVLRIKAAVL